MLYIIPPEHFEKITNDNLNQIVSYFYKDYPEIIAYYADVIENLYDRPDLLDRVRDEVVSMIEEVAKYKEDITKIEPELVEQIRKNFNESNKVINSMAIKIAITNQENSERSENDMNAENLLNSLI